MDLNLNDKIIVISGGIKSIGESIVKLLADEGAVPVIIGRNGNENVQAVNAIISAGGKCFYDSELSQPGEYDKSIQTILKEFGRIDCLVNNTSVKDAIDLTHVNSELFINSLHKKLVPYYLMAHYALPALKKSKGSIVNISLTTSVAGKRHTFSTINNGISALTREWAVELLKYNIRVNAVIITECATQLYNPQKGSEEIANTVAFLLSEKSSHTTGQLICINALTV